MYTPPEFYVPSANSGFLGGAIQGIHMGEAIKRLKAKKASQQKPATQQQDTSLQPESDPYGLLDQQYTSQGVA